jgi:hypothetical protein
MAFDYAQCNPDIITITSSELSGYLNWEELIPGTLHLNLSIIDKNVSITCNDLTDEYWVIMVSGETFMYMYTFRDGDITFTYSARGQSPSEVGFVLARDAIMLIYETWLIATKYPNAEVITAETLPEVIFGETIVNGKTYAVNVFEMTINDSTVFGTVRLPTMTTVFDDEISFTIRGDEFEHCYTIKSGFYILTCVGPSPDEVGWVLDSSAVSAICELHDTAVWAKHNSAD